MMYLLYCVENMLKMVLLCNNEQLRKISPLFSLSQAWQPLLFSQIQCSPLCPLKTRMPPIQSQSHTKVRNHTCTQLVSDFLSSFFYVCQYIFFITAVFSSVEIEVRQDMKLESDKKLEKLESFLGRLNGKGWYHKKMCNEP